MIRDHKPEDIFDLEDIHAKSCTFPFPNYNSPSNILKKTVSIAGNIVGSAYVHLTAEVGLILDKELPAVTRAKVIKDLFSAIINEMEKTDLEDYHFYINPEDTGFEAFLVNNFSIERDKGISLCGWLKNEQVKREQSKIVGNGLDEPSVC